MTARPRPRERARSLLVAAYYFPPWGGGPVLRTLKLVKYLPRLGWRVRVLTAQPRYYEPVSHDPKLLEEVGPETAILRTRSLQPTGSVAQGLLAAAIGARHPRLSLTRLLMPLARLVHELLIPDDKLLWLPWALLGGIRLLREERPDVVYVTAPPHSTALLGLALSWLARRPLVVDFRDDWVGNPLYRRAWAVRAAIEGLQERAVVRAAAAVLVPTPSSRALLARKYPAAAGRAHVVPNGFDDEDVRRARRQPPPVARAAPAEELWCVYAGLVTSRRDLAPLFEALRRVSRSQRGTVRLRFAGFLPEEGRGALARLGLEQQVSELGYLSHLEALRQVLAADVAILISTAAEGARTAVPSKLYEYVACGTVVLGLVDPGMARELIERNGWGVTCSPADADGIERALLELLERKRAGRLILPAAAVERVAAYSRRAQAGAVAGLLEQLLVERADA